MFTPQLPHPLAGWCATYGTNIGECFPEHTCRDGECYDSTHLLSGQDEPNDSTWN